MDSCDSSGVAVMAIINVVVVVVVVVEASKVLAIACVLVAVAIMVVLIVDNLTVSVVRVIVGVIDPWQLLKQVKHQSVQMQRQQNPQQT